MSDDLSRFRAHCFQFACDKLDPGETAWMQEMLQRHPELQEEVDAERELAHQAREALMAQQQSERPLVSFDQIRQALAQRQPVRKQGWFERLAVWWRNLAATPASRRGRWALAAVVVLGVMVTLQTRHLIDGDSTPAGDYRSLQAGTDSKSAALEVVFNDGVALGNLRTQLEAMHLRIRSGPDANGAYEVVVVQGSLEAAMQSLKDSALVREVRVREMRDRDRERP